MRNSSLKNVPMVISSEDSLIKINCASCGGYADGSFSTWTRAQRYNERGNYCLMCHAVADEYAVQNYVANLSLIGATPDKEHKRLGHIPWNKGIKMPPFSSYKPEGRKRRDGSFR